MAASESPENLVKVSQQTGQETERKREEVKKEETTGVHCNEVVPSVLRNCKDLLAIVQEQHVQKQRREIKGEG